MEQHEIAALFTSVHEPSKSPRERLFLYILLIFHTGSCASLTIAPSVIPCYDKNIKIF